MACVLHATPAPLPAAQIWIQGSHSADLVRDETFPAGRQSGVKSQVTALRGRLHFRLAASGHRAMATSAPCRYQLAKTLAHFPFVGTLAPSGASEPEPDRRSPPAPSTMPAAGSRRLTKGR